MNCPNCGNEIKENQKFCTKCGDEIKNAENGYLSENIKKNTKSFIIGFMLLLIFVVAVILVFVFPRTDTTTYKSIVPITQNEMENMTEHQALDILVQQETDLNKYINKKPNMNIDKLFETFYRNMLLFTGQKSDMDSKLSFDIYDYTENEQKSFIVENITIQYENEDTYRIVNPQTDIIKIKPIEEGIWGAEINDEYIIKKYSKNLSNEWIEYLKIFNNSDNWWLNWFYDEIKFSSIYPKFCLQDIINNDLKNYMSRFSEYTNYYSNSEYDKALYQKFLSIKDNNLQEYKKIKQWYEILEKDNFMLGINYYKYEYDLTNDEYYKEKYEELLIQEENKIAKEKAINEYKNLKFDKEQLYLAYKEANKHWESNKNLCEGNYCYEIHLREYLENKNLDYGKIYDVISQYCSVITNGSHVDVQNCKIKEFEKLK